jgi:hypothetical protein
MVAGVIFELTNFGLSARNRTCDSLILCNLIRFWSLEFFPKSFPTSIAGVLLPSADVILPLGFAICKCGTNVLCPLPIARPSEAHTHARVGNLSLRTIFPWLHIRSRSGRVRATGFSPSPANSLLCFDPRGCGLDQRGKRSGRTSMC